MSKNYTMVRIVWAPGTFPANNDLREAVLGKVDTYIKAGKAPMVGAWSTSAELETNKPADYRASGCLNTRLLVKNEFDMSLPQTTYRIFTDADAASEFVSFVLEHGAVTSDIIVESDIGTKGIDPAVEFPSESRVAQLIWPGYPNFVYSGTYPAAGDPTATPVF
jgi:hypothetical protein